MLSARGEAFLDRARVIPTDFDWRAYDATTDERHKVKPAADYLDDLLAEFNGSAETRGALWPWNKANDRGLRFRPGEVTVYAGVNGNRKSMVTAQIAVHLMRQNYRVLMSSFEMRPKKTLGRMVCQSAGASKPSDDYICRWASWTNDRLWLYDHLGMCGPRQTLAVARYALIELGVKHVFVDSLMKVIKATDDYNGQKEFIGALCALALTHDAHIHLVAHCRKGRDERAGIDKWDVKGAGEITDQADNVCLVSKRDDPPAGEPNQWLEVAKQRDGAWEGILGLYFHAEALSFSESLERRWPGISPAETEIDAERLAIQSEGA